MKKKIYHQCSILRTKEVTHGTMSMGSGAYTKGKIDTVTEPCGSPLFDDERQKSGVCRSCADGWEVKDNAFANPREKRRAEAAPKTKAQ